MKKAWKDDNLLLNEMFERRRNEDTICEVDRCYKNFESDLKKKVEDYFEEKDFPFELTSLKYDKKTKKLEMYVTMWLKCYGDRKSYTSEEKLCGRRSTLDEDSFFFDNSINEMKSHLLFPLGLVKDGRWYPTCNFHYSDYGIDGKPHMMHFVDYINIYITKEFD